MAKILDEYKFTAQQIFNVDETGLTTVQNPGKVVTARGVRNVGSVTSAERRELVTAVYTIYGSGSVLSPCLFFPVYIIGIILSEEDLKIVLDNAANLVG